MSFHDVLDLLEGELGRHHERDSGEDLFRDVLDLARRIIAGDREGLVEALDAWLKQRSSPRTQIAMEIAGQLKLTEVRSELERFREDVLSGKHGPRRDPWLIDKAIQAMS